MRSTQALGASFIATHARRALLRFPDAELERHFLLSYRAAARPWIRMSLLVALSTVLGFTVIDHWLLVGPRLARPDIWRFGLQHQPPIGVMIALFAIAIAAAEAAVGLALVIAVYRHYRTTNVDQLDQLKG